MFLYTKLSSLPRLLDYVLILAEFEQQLEVENAFS